LHLNGICSNCEVKNTTDSVFCKKCGAYLHDAGDDPIRIDAESKGITERKKTYAALQESEQNYRSLVDQARDGIAAIQDEKIKFVNSYIADLLGYTIEELLDSSFMDYIEPAERPKAVDNYRRRMRGEDSLPVYESVLMRKDGSRVEVEFNAGIATFDGKPADIVIVRDITMRKRVEKERDRILDLTLDMVCVSDFDGYLKFLNPAWEQTLGYTNDELFEQPFLSFVHPDDQANTVAEIKKLASGQLTVNFENRYLHKDGSIRHMLWVATPIPEEKVMYAIARNITDRKNAEKEIDRYMNRLKALALQLTLTE